MKWMIFQPEGADVLYLYNGETVYLIHVAPHEGENKDWYWAANPDATPIEVPEMEERILKDMLASTRKGIFSIPRKGKRRFIVLERDTYNYQFA